MVLFLSGYIVSLNLNILDLKFPKITQFWAFTSQNYFQENPIGLNVL